MTLFPVSTTTLATSLNTLNNWLWELFMVHCNVRSLNNNLFTAMLIWTILWTWYCCDRKSQAACAQSFTLWQQATRDHAPQSLLLLLARATYIMVLFFMYIPFVVNHTINATPRNSCNNIPSFLQRTTSHALCVKAELSTTSTSWSQHLFVAIGNPERHVRKASHCGSKQQ